MKNRAILVSILISMLLLAGCNFPWGSQTNTGITNTGGSYVPGGSTGVTSTGTATGGTWTGMGTWTTWTGAWSVGTWAMELSTANVMYFPGRNQYVGYLVRPTATGGTFPALILIHEWWGLNDNIKELAKDFANEGYVVLAVDLYGTGATTDEEVARKRASAVTSDEQTAFKNLDAAVTYLKDITWVDPNRIWSVGWCFGGWWAYQMAKNNLGTKATVMYYGRFNTADDLSMMRSQILGHFGEKDTSIAVNTVKEFQAKLQTLSGSNAVYIYPNAGHGFANEPDPTYDKAAADLAWQRTVDFLQKNLKNQ